MRGVFCYGFFDRPTWVDFWKLSKTKIKSILKDILLLCCGVATSVSILSVVLFTDGWSRNDEGFKKRKSGGGISNGSGRGGKSRVETPPEWMGEMKTPFLGKAIKMNLTFPPPGMGVGKLHILTHSDIYYIGMIHNLCPVWFLLN